MYTCTRLISYDLLSYVSINIDILILLIDFIFHLPCMTETIQSTITWKFVNTYNCLKHISSSKPNEVRKVYHTKSYSFFIVKKNNIPFAGFRQVQEGPFVNTSPQSSGNQDSGSCSTMSYLLESVQDLLMLDSAFGEG